MPSGNHGSSATLGFLLVSLRRIWTYFSVLPLRSFNWSFKLYFILVKSLLACDIAATEATTGLWFSVLCFWLRLSCACITTEPTETALWLFWWLLFLFCSAALWLLFGLNFASGEHRGSWLLLCWSFILFLRCIFDNVAHSGPCHREGCIVFSLLSWRTIFSRLSFIDLLTSCEVVIVFRSLWSITSIAHPVIKLCSSSWSFRYLGASAPSITRRVIVVMATFTFSLLFSLDL